MKILIAALDINQAFFFKTLINRIKKQADDNFVFTIISQNKWISQQFTGVADQILDISTSCKFLTYTLGTTSPHSTIHHPFTRSGTELLKVMNPVPVELVQSMCSRKTLGKYLDRYVLPCLSAIDKHDIFLCHNGYQAVNILLRNQYGRENLCFEIANKKGCYQFSSSLCDGKTAQDFTEKTRKIIDCLSMHFITQFKSQPRTVLKLHCSGLTRSDYLMEWAFRFYKGKTLAWHRTYIIKRAIGKVLWRCLNSRRSSLIIGKARGHEHLILGQNPLDTQIFYNGEMTYRVWLKKLIDSHEQDLFFRPHPKSYDLSLLFDIVLYCLKGKLRISSSSIDLEDLPGRFSKFISYNSTAAPKIADLGGTVIKAGKEDDPFICRV